jgi:predicted amidohydrolase YtcJ
MPPPRSVRSLAILLTALFAVLCASNLSAQERLFVNAKVFTGNPQHPYAEAVAIRGDKIVSVGSRTEAAAGLGNSPEIIDLGGKTLLPGLIDSHVHAVSGGVKLLSTDVANKVRSIEELASIASLAKKTGRGMSGDVLFVSGIPLEVWSHIKELNARFNAGEFAAQPVVLQGMDGHTGWANQAMRTKVGLDQAYIGRLSESERKYYGYEPNLTPNGFAVDAGLRVVRKQIPGPDAQKLLAGAQAAVDYLHSLGITSWLDPSVTEKTLIAYRDLAAANKLTAHVAAFVVVQPNDPEPLAEAQELRKKFSGVPGLTIPGVKVYADGVVEYPSQSAAMFAPYGKTGKLGDLLFEPKKFEAMCIQADKEGLIVHTHAIGDRAVAESLNGIGAARKANGNSGLPHTITHLQFIRPEDIQRFKPLGVIASFQLLWAEAGVDTIDIVEPYVTPEIYKWQYPARSMLNAGAMIAGASDWGVSSPNVFFAIYQAETRKGAKGVLDANQDMPRDAMLYAYTINAARAMNQQDALGSIDPGKQADLTLLDRDVMTVSPEEMKDTKILWTMVGGEWVYRSK